MPHRQRLSNAGSRCQPRRPVEQSLLRTQTRASVNVGSMNSSLSTRTVLVLAALLATTLAAPSVADAGNAHDRAPSVPTLDWIDCGDGLQCSNALVPPDLAASAAHGDAQISRFALARDYPPETRPIASDPDLREQRWTRKLGASTSSVVARGTCCPPTFQASVRHRRVRSARWSRPQHAGAVLRRRRVTKEGSSGSLPPFSASPRG
jgi:hypothetical protein